MDTNIFNIIEFENELKKIVPKGDISIPPQINFGHLSFNGLFIDKSKKEELIKFIDNCNFIKKYEILPSGFLNMWINNITVNMDVSQLNNNETIHIEYCSPNPTGDLHLGHFRNIIVGFAVVNLLKLTGHNVITEIYINDQGLQMDQFFETVLYYISKDDKYKIYYKGEYVKDIAEELGTIVDKTALVDLLLVKIQKTLSSINVKHDIVVKESSLHNQMEKVMEILKEKNLIYEGKLENQKTTGTHILLKTSEMGLETDSVLKRNNESYTYFAFDIAYHYDKYLRGFKNQICVVAEDHQNHINKLQTTLKNVFDINVKYIKYHMLHLLKGTELIIMSKREGNIISIPDLLKIVNLDYAKWIILSYNNQKTIRLDLDNITNNNVIVDLKHLINFINELTYVNDAEDITIDPLFRLTLFWKLMIQKSVQNFDNHKILEFTTEIIKEAKKIVSNIIGNKVPYKYKLVFLNVKTMLQFTCDVLHIS